TMEGHDNKNGTPPPPPPLPQSRTPPTSPPDPVAKTIPNNPPRPQAHSSSLPPRRPQIRRGDSSRGSFSRRSGRDRSNSNHSNDVGFHGSLSRPQMVGFEGRSQNYVTSDASMLLASMDKRDEAVEDEAESTLLDVLERRQVTFAQQSNARSSHRRNRTAYADVLPSIDLLNLGTSPTNRPSSAPSSGEGAPLPRPNLPSRSVSYGRSQRNSYNRSPPTLAGSGRATSDWAFDSQGQLLQSFSGQSEQPERGLDNGDRGSPRRLSGHGIMHRHAGSAIPQMRFDRGVSDSSRSQSSVPSMTVPSGLSTPGERARYVAMTMKTIAANDSEDPGIGMSIGEGDLPDLMQVFEAQRDNDSAGGSRKSGGGASSRMSVTHSAESRSRGGSRGASSGFSGGGYRSQRPFSGITSSPFSNDMSNGIDRLFEVAEHVQELCIISEEEDEEIIAPADLEMENTNFLQAVMSSHPEVSAFPEDMEEKPEGENAGADEQTPMLQQNNIRRFATPISGTRTNTLWSSITQPAPGSRFYKFFMWWAELRKQMKVLAVAIDVHYVKERLWAFFQNEVSLFIVPALAISAFFYYSIISHTPLPALFYYRLNNPTLHFLPTDASISWWILFCVRQYLMLNLAYVSEYFFVDVLAMRSLISVYLIGPLATLYTINAKGWPFILTSWGVMSFLFIREGHESSHSSHAFFSHWLSFTEIEMFTEENPSGGVVQSDRYSELLLSMMIAGVATSLKRTILALYLGKRVYTHYKPRLEKLMESMILLTEVADLGNAIDDFEFEKVDQAADQTESKKSSTRQSTKLTDNIRTSTMNAVVKKQNVKSAEPDSDSDEEITEEESKDNTGTTWNRLRSGSVSSDENENSGLNEDDKRPSGNSLDKAMANEKDALIESENPPPDTTPHEENPQVELPAMGYDEPPIKAVHEPVQGLLSREASTTTRIKSLLDGWEEPVNKADKMEEPTIHEILQFRKAMSFLDDMEPFGSSFGPASSRDSCIKSAKSLYKRLLALSPGTSVLHFDIIGVLAYNVDGTFDDKKAKSLVRLFRPDKFDEGEHIVITSTSPTQAPFIPIILTHLVSMLHFVQSCDGIYKKLRYLRASVGNSTLIDSVLENIFNAAFGFFLLLTSKFVTFVRLRTVLSSLSPPDNFAFFLSVLSVLQLNPWTLLVSLSTVLVSFAFALGPSAAKLIEGMIMIAVRRPFDLGDRISIVECTGAPDNSDDPGYHDTWIVEDCNLFTTTLRLSRTNEVSTVNNGSISNTRIVNHGRSMNAMVNISLRMNIEASHDQVQIVKLAVEQYIRDNPRVWAALMNFRITHVDPANDLLAYSMRVRHVKSWQDLLPISQARGDLEKFCQEILIKLGIHYDCAVTTND
ncbi:hypothetical protein ACHAXR_008875, partial [Thalassiosira sp. AJA248-18]